MKQIIRLTLLAICCLLAAAGKMHAETDRPYIIRKDRVWESLSSDNSGTYTSHFFKFDGTDERDGKTYDRLIAFKKVKYNRWPEMELIDKEDDIEEIHALMREEDGMVYSYIDSSCAFTGLCEGDLLEREIVLYDFNASETETYESVGFVMCSELFPAYFRVSSVDYIDIAGERCKRMMIEASTDIDDFWGFGDFEIIEGIGFTDKGCLFYNGYFGILTSMYFDLYFLRVFDHDGNILYGDREWITPDGIQVGVDGMDEVSGRLSFNEGEIHLASSRTCEINLHDMQGAFVASAAGSGNVSLPLAGLQRGVYVATAISDGHILGRRKIFVK